MSLNLTSMYETLNLQEHIPAQLRKGMSSGMSVASVVQARTNARYVPLNGTSFTYSTTGGSASSQIISFKLTDSQNFLDLQSCYLNFTFTLAEIGARAADPAAADPGTNYTVIDDGLYSLFSRARVSANNIVVEDINSLNALTNALIYSNCSKDVYDNVLGNLCLAWKHNTTIPIDATCTSLLASRRKAIGRMLFPTRGAVTNAVGSSIAVSIPLSLMIPTFQNPTYFPLRNCPIQLDLYVDSLKNVLLTAGGLDATLSISNISMTCDLLTLDPVFTAASDKLLADADGFKMPITTYLVSDGSYAGSTTHTAKNAIYGKATPLLRSMLFWRRIPSFSNVLNRYSVSAFPRFDQGNPLLSMGSNIKINGQQYPSNSMFTTTEHFRELTKLFGGFSMLSHTVQNLQSYSNYHGIDDLDYQAYTWGFSFDKLGSGEDQVIVDGIDCTQSGVIQVSFSDMTPAGPSNGTIVDIHSNNNMPVMVAAIQHTRFLVIANNQVQMIGM